jgi:hypothetical protein
VSYLSALSPESSLVCVVRGTVTSVYRLSYRFTNSKIIDCLTTPGPTVFCSNNVDNTSQQDFIPRKVYCVSNVTFRAESKYAIKIFPSPTVFVQWHFLLLIFRYFSYFLHWFFFYMNKYFKLFWTQGGHIQFTVIKSLAVCAQKQAVNETNVDSWR